MIPLTVAFWTLVILFSFIGSFRGWAKEMLVTFGVILAIFLITVLERFVPFIRDTVSYNSPITLYWIRTILTIALVFFAYQTPNIPRFAQGNRFARDRLQDSLLGFFLGALNGFMVIGSLWFFLHDAKYPGSWVIAPQPGTVLGDEALRMIAWLPPNWFGAPAIYFAVALAFAFILVVFI